MKLNYFVLGTTNMEASVHLYDALFAGSGFRKFAASERMTYWLGDDFAFAVALPFDQHPATNGNGTMVGFDTGSEEEVKRLFQRALDLDGNSEGEPGQRGPRFSAYFRDLDQNKICVFG